MTDPSCDVAHGEAVPEVEHRGLVAVFDTPVVRHLVRYARDLGYSAVVYEPSGTLPELDGAYDVVVTDHHREELGTVLRDVLAYPVRWVGVMGNPRHEELGTVLRDVLAYPVRWVGVMGNPRHEGPHVAALKALGVPDEQIARVHRPVGLDIGSRTPPEIAIATIAGLVADRNGRPGGFEF
ncbi:XdhC family protein [Kibdelosporangium phytohabitans]|uniref:Xanthine dehydrogenase n=1 Tax=Kibdelosporangium phytohabitans TaxID=860235 RepID=A0A0N9HZW8_9PSEU|nr:XdhC family protein [Kibdelosporangium phytohabitans]ALG07780.1 xanthine dehydrogenase [Kibdelosporangium phytohabitans]MBE1471303.1 xanthine/CO dehydrogenase XdhC/CoxF family maturation factor [Kibdelosporangium phytohabitans]